MPLTEELTRELQRLRVLEAEHQIWLRTLLPCGCNPPLLGYRPGVGPRCRTCNRTFRIVEVEPDAK